MELPYMLKFFIAEQPIQPDYNMNKVLVDGLVQDNYCFGAVISSNASDTVRHRYSAIVRTYDRNYKTVLVENGGFTISLVNCVAQYFYPIDSRGYSGPRVMISISSPELLKKTGGKPVILYTTVNDVFDHITSSRSVVDLKIPGNYYISTFGCNYYITNIELTKFDSTSKVEIERGVRLSKYRSGSQTTKLVPGRLYLFKHNKYAGIYLGNIKKVLGNRNNCVPETPKMNAISPRIIIRGIELLEHVDIFIEVDYDDHCIPLLDSPTKKTIQEFFELLLNNNVTIRFNYVSTSRRTKLKFIDTEEVLSIPEDYDINKFMPDLTKELYEKTKMDVFRSLNLDLYSKENVLEILRDDILTYVSQNIIHKVSGNKWNNINEILTSYLYNEITHLLTNKKFLGFSFEELAESLRKVMIECK